MSCRDVFQHLQEYLGRELTPAQRAAFEEHLGRCGSCAAFLRSYEETLLLLGSGREKEGAQELPEELVQAILRAASDLTN